MLLRVRSRWSAVLAIGSLTASLALAENNAPAKSDAKPAVQPESPADSITEGSVKVAGQAIEYSAIAGTITVGSSDPQDAMIGFDGKYLPDASVDLSAKPEDRPATSRMFYVAYLEKNP